MQVFFFKTKSGNSPIEKYIDKLPEEDQARFLEVVDEIEREGLEACRVIFKPIEGKLWEIKFRAGTSGYRVFYVLITKDEMVWLHVIKKKTQKTPKKELKTARQRMKEVLYE